MNIRSSLKIDKKQIEYNSLLNYLLFLLNYHSKIITDMLQKEEKKLAKELCVKYDLDENLVGQLIDRAMEIRYKDRVYAGFKEELRDIIYQYANKNED